MRRLQLLWFALAAVGLLLSGSSAAQGERVASGTTKLSPHDEAVVSVVDLATREPGGAALEQAIQRTQNNLELQETLEQRVQGKLNRPGLSPQSTAKGKALLGDSKAVSQEFATELTWLQRAQKFLQVVDIVSTGAKATAYLVEGDGTGATTVVLDDVCKKGCAAAGAFGLSFIPVVGPIAGAFVGEEVHNTYVRPRLEQRADELREWEAKTKLLNKPWLAPTLVTNERGETRELPADMYVQRGTGLVRRRTASQQKAYEEEQRLNWLNAKEIERLHTDFLGGSLSESEYDRALRDYRQRDPTKPWEPPALVRSADAGAGEMAPGDGKILELVTPVKVTAIGSLEQDLGALEFDNVATATITFVFWNVGNLAPGYGDVLGTVVTTFSMRPGEKEETSCRGTFSGGPNGKFHFNCEGESSTATLSQGVSVKTEEGTLMVLNPMAFEDWPEDLP